MLCWCAEVLDFLFIFLDLKELSTTETVCFQLLAYSSSLLDAYGSFYLPFMGIIQSLCTGKGQLNQSDIELLRVVLKNNWIALG